MKYEGFSHIIALALIFVMSLSVAGCWTMVKDDHPLALKNPSSSHAEVYFIRARTERFMGMADNRVTVLVNQLPLIELVKGEYTLVNLAPGFTAITVANQTTYGPAHKIKTNKRSRGYTFKAGNTYYILIDPVDGEFRGIHFIPRSIDIAEASRLSKNIRAIGLARNQSITSSTAN